MSIAKDKNGLVKKQNRNLKWICKCECGNIKEVSGTHLKSGHTKGCGKCNFNNLVGEKFGKLIVLGVCIDKDNNIKKQSESIMWRCLCECGNTTVVRSTQLRNGAISSCGASGCVGYKTQNKLAEIVNNIFSKNTVEQNYKNFNWLKNTDTGRNMEIDVFVPELKLAIEYDGEQHFKPVMFGGISYKKATDNLKKQRYLDKLKNKLIMEHPDDVNFFIRFNYMEKLTKKLVVKKLIKVGVPNLKGE